MKITGLEISQFKGIVSLQEAELSDVVNISGDNETGKTTIANGIIWCLFGKDIEGRSNFEIMPLGANNIMVPQMEPTVFLCFYIDGRNKTFKRIMKQKWVKKRGEESKIFDGSCETEYFVDDVPMKQKDFMEHVNDLCNEDVFRCITLPSYFPSLEWKKRRDIITSIVGDVDVKKVNKDFVDLVDKLNGRKIEDYRKVIAIEKKGYKDEKDRIPEGIKASQKFLEGAEDWTQIQKEIDKKSLQIVAIEKKISDKSAVLDQYNKTLQKNAEKVRLLNQEKQSFIDGWTEELRKEKSVLNVRISSLSSEQSTVKNDIIDLNINIDGSKRSVSANDDEIVRLKSVRDDNKQKWIAVNKSEFKEPENDKCGSCGQDIILTYEEIEENREKFNLDKSNDLEEIIKKNEPLIKQSESCVNQIDILSKQIDSKEKQLEELNKKAKDIEQKTKESVKEYDSSDINSLESEVKKLPDYVAFDVKINELTSKEAPSIDVSEFTAEKQVIQSDINALRDRLAKKATISLANRNIATYEARFKELAQKIVSLEGVEFQTEKYEKALMSDLETKVNSRFKGIQFKMFETQINQGIKLTCVILINGVPYNAANTAAKIQAGIQIINVLSDHYNVTVPILIDNRESVIEIPETKSQVFNMTVIKGQKLKIS